MKSTEYAAWATHNVDQQITLGQRTLYAMIKAAFEAGERESKDRIRYEGVRGVSDEAPVPPEYICGATGRR